MVRICMKGRNDTGRQVMYAQAKKRGGRAGIKERGPSQREETDTGHSGMTEQMSFTCVIVSVTPPYVLQTARLDAKR